MVRKMLVIPEMCNQIQFSGKRGGISQCSKRYIKANNKYMDDKYDPNKQTSYIIYLDCNNQYGHSMAQPLPYNGFKWADEREFVLPERIECIPDDSKIGYFLEVDVKYPKNLHDEHNDYPFLAERRCPPNSKNEKLVLTLDNKKNYFIHHQMLKMALKHGLILEKVHRVLQFNQSKWLEPYISLNTEMRTKAKNEFEKNFYKLLINTIYGKAMENVRDRVNVKIPTKWEGRYGCGNLIADPTFKRRLICNKDCVIVEMNRTCILMDKPISIGVAVLDISKTWMYDLHYDFIKKTYETDAVLAYTDTDSFIYQMKDDFYLGVKNHLENTETKDQRYDTSDYPNGNQFGIPAVNKKKPGLFKDELKSIIITDFIGLRSKMYAIKTIDEDCMKKAKGVKKAVIKNDITFDDFKKCLDESASFSGDHTSFRSKCHEVFTVSSTKIALSSSDDKRHIETDGIRTLAWGHKSLSESNLPIPMDVD